MSELETTHIMDEEAQLHEAQAGELFNMVSKQRLSSSALQGLQMDSLSSASTIQEYKEKLQGRPSDLDGKADHISDDEGGSDGSDAEPASKADLRAAGAALPSAAAPSSAAAVAPGGLDLGSASAKKKPKPFGYLQQPAAGSKNKTSPKAAGKLPRASSFSSVGDRPEVEGAASVASGSINRVAKTQCDDQAGDEEVAKHMAKLPLLKIMAGEKYKLSLHHASEAKPKLSQNHQIRLGGHLKLVGMAAKLAPALIPTTPASELEEAIKALITRVEPQTWPVETQVALFTRQVQEQVQLVRCSTDKKQVLQFWHTIKPFYITGAAAKDFTAIKLGELDVTMEVKAKRFLDLMLSDLLLPEVLGGEAGVARLHFLCPIFVEECATSFMQDIEADCAVQALSDVETACRGLQALLAESIEKQVQDKEHVEALLSLQKQGIVSSPLSVLAAALLESTYWTEKLTSFSNMQRALKIHATLLEKTSKYVEEGKPEQTDDMVAALASTCKGLCTLQDELPENSLRELSEQLFARLTNVWQAFLRGDPS